MFEFNGSLNIYYWEHKLIGFSCNVPEKDILPVTKYQIDVVLHDPLMCFVLFS